MTEIHGFPEITTLRTSPARPHGSAAEPHDPAVACNLGSAADMLTPRWRATSAAADMLAGPDGLRGAAVAPGGAALRRRAGGRDVAWPAGCCSEARSVGPARGLLRRATAVLLGARAVAPGARGVGPVAVDGLKMPMYDYAHER